MNYNSGLTETPSGRSSLRRLSLKPSIANLLAEYTLRPPVVVRPSNELTLMTRPLDARSSGRNFWVNATTPKKFTSITKFVTN